ncbi:hypothetical protein WB388_08930 [Streptomyces brasiliscabiei]|uniref:Secreted protein n=1 Tax=Streptomyces brasiliscabiei TaxID=2736302 RepID=A0ABU8GA00_9ACTN
MIGYVLLIVGGIATAVVVYAVAPAGRGLHRYAVPRAQLRATISRLETDVDDRSTKLLGALSELDGAHEALDATRDERDNALAALEKAESQVTELHEQLRDADQLREANTALKAQLANALAVSSLPPHASPSAPDTSVLEPVPLHRAPLAGRPAGRN